MFRSLLVLTLAAIAYSCATPISPTGGPPDKTGPEIIDTEPVTGTTNFKKKKITIHFSEFVNRSSVSGAIVVEPDIGIPYSLKWGRKSVSIAFDEALPELTTVIISIGTSLKDMHGNGLAVPKKIAVSTGPEIDKGGLVGNIIDAKTGKGEEGKRILLYRAPVDLSAKANYVAETDTGGAFTFSYLAEGTYKAFWADDRNRNKIWDRKQERAQPFSVEQVTLAKSQTDTLGTLFIAQSDTSAPELQGVGLFSSQRLRLRFSESVRLTDSTRIQITDTLGGDFSEAYPLYIPESDPYILFAQSVKKTVPESPYTLKITNISDLSGNIQPGAEADFTGSGQTDTTVQRLISFRHEEGLYPDEAQVVVYATAISEPAVTDSLKVAEGTTMHDKWTALNIENNELYIRPDTVWKEGVEYEFRVWNPQINQYKNYRPVIWHSKQLGALDISIEDTSDTTAYQLRLSSEERGITADTSFIKSIMIDKLPPLDYQLKIFKDINKNGHWDYGRVDPFKAPEPYYIRNGIPVKKGFTSDLTVSVGK